MNLSGWDYLPEEANSKKKPNRLDWDFTWEKHGFRAKDAPYRLQVTVQGDKVGGSEEFLHVPEAWERGYQRLRSGNDTLTLVFLLPYISLLGIAIWLGIQLTKSGKTTWGAAIKLGVLAAFFYSCSRSTTGPFGERDTTPMIPTPAFILLQNRARARCLPWQRRSRLRWSCPRQSRSTAASSRANCA